LAKTSQSTKRADTFSGTAWTAVRTPDGYQVLELHIAQGEVVVVAKKGEPNLKEIACPVIEGLVADFLVGGGVA
jgi:hypothetical protein